jgi:YfiH family protein
MSEPLAIFSQFPELVALLSTRADGDMKLRDMADDNIARRNAFFEAHGIPSSSVIGVYAAHAADVIRVGAREAGAVMKHVDGLFTDEPGVFLSVTAADCLAVYFYDPVDRVIALAHAGWRGLARGIISKALRQFEHPERVRVAISPFIQSCHFEVGDDVISAFSAHAEAVIERDGHFFVDMGAIAFRQLLEGGVDSEYIEVSEECTMCSSSKYFSYRHDKPNLEVMVAVLGIRK